MTYAFDHVGMLVHDIERAKAPLGILGYDTFSERYVDEHQKIHIVFATRANDLSHPRLELVQSVHESSVVASLLIKTGATPYHLCFRAADLDGAITAFDDAGYLLLRPAAPSPAFAGARFCFMYQREIGLVELVEMR